jgi:hypothetical protein
MANIQNREELSAFLRQWLSDNPEWSIDYSDRWNPRRRSAQEISVAIFSAMENEDVRLAEWFQTPGGELLIWAAEHAIGPYAGNDLNLFVEAVTLAAQARNKNQKLAAGVLIGIALFLAIGFIKAIATK